MTGKQVEMARDQSKRRVRRLCFAELHIFVIKFPLSQKFTSLFKLYESQREKTYLLISASSKDRNQPTRPRSLIRVFVIRMETLCILGYPKCAQWRFWSACANAQADLNLRWAHIPEVTFSDVAQIIYFLRWKDDIRNASNVLNLVFVPGNNDGFALIFFLSVWLANRKGVYIINLGVAAGESNVSVASSVRGHTHPARLIQGLSYLFTVFTPVIWTLDSLKVE